jgi:HEAT repeat protein
MSVTMDEVRSAVEPDEPDYPAAAARLGVAALPLLSELIQGDDPALASKAASLAGNIDGAESLEVLREAARSPQAVVRIAAAASVGGLSELPVTDLLAALLDDEDPYVRKVALDSVASTHAAGAARKIRVLAEQDPEAFVRDVAEATLRLLGTDSGEGR